MAYPGYPGATTLDRVSSARMPQLDENAALGILHHLETEQLKNLLEGEDKLNDLINDLQQVKSLQVDREMLMASNKSLAEYNLNRQPDLDTAKERLAESYEIALGKKKQFDTDKQKLDAQTSQHSIETVHALLQTEAAKTEEKSEAMAEAFLEGKSDVDTFLTEFVEQRTKAHLQRIKVEKMTDLVRNHQNRSQATRQSSWGQAPYPAGSSMPDPSAYRPR